MLYICFGLAGSGKNYFAKWFSSEFNFHFEDADQWLTDEMRDSIEKNQPFTQTMRDRFFDYVIQQIQELKKNHPRLVIAQACYKEKNRQQLLEALPEAKFILIESSINMIVMRLKERNNETTLEYANIIARQFEHPSHPYIEIDNSQQNFDSALLRQCQRNTDLMNDLREPERIRLRRAY